MDLKPILTLPGQPKVLAKDLPLELFDQLLTIDWVSTNQLLAEFKLKITILGGSGERMRMNDLFEEHYDVSVG